MNSSCDEFYEFKPGLEWYISGVAMVVAFVNAGLCLLWGVDSMPTALRIVLGVFGILLLFVGAISGIRIYLFFRHFHYEGIRDWFVGTGIRGWLIVRYTRKEKQAQKMYNEICWETTCDEAWDRSGIFPFTVAEMRKIIEERNEGVNSFYKKRKEKLWNFWRKIEKKREGGVK